MGDEERGLAGATPDRLQLLLQQLAGLGIERAERLVHQHDFRDRARTAAPARPAASCRRSTGPDRGRRSGRGERDRDIPRALARRSRLGSPFISSGQATFSMAVSQGNSESSWNIMPRSGPGRSDRPAVERAARPRSRARSRRGCAGTCSCRSPTARRWRRTRARRSASDRRSIAVTLRLSTVNVLSRSVTSSSGIVTGLVSSGQRAKLYPLESIRPSVPSHPFFDMSNTTPSGSLNFRSKFPRRSSPRSKKNVPPDASIFFCVSARSSTWKPK